LTVPGDLWEAGRLLAYLVRSACTAEQFAARHGRGAIVATIEDVLDPVFSVWSDRSDGTR
jgi:hypothetical protein